MKYPGWPVYVLLAILFLAAGGLASFIIKTDYSVGLPKADPPCTPRPGFDLRLRLTGIAADRLRDEFPYAGYADSADLCSIAALRHDLAVLDSLFPANTPLHHEVVSTALTNTLETRLAPSFVRYSPDSLLAIAHWAERFHYYKDIDKTHARLYKVIYSHWMNFISNRLGAHYEQDSRH